MKIQTKTGRIFSTDSRTDPEAQKRAALVATCTDLALLRKQKAGIEKDISTAKERLETLTGLTGEVAPEDAKPVILPGLGQVIRVYQPGAARIDRGMLVEFLMKKLRATGEQANQIADAATVRTPSSYIDFKADKKEG